ncbi:MAG: FAD/NAD(P)-binding protein [Actinomycetales bacterium]|nr:FAD/NAD(P)-binding protein [Actinomycetales bacterium]
MTSVGTTTPSNPPRLLIVGGGAAGCLVAIQVLRRARGPLLIEVAEPRPRLAEGVAYATGDPAHVLNVPAGRMSALPEQPDDFRRWAGSDASAFLPRGRYAQYLRDVLAQAIADAPPQVTFRHRQDRVLSLRARTGGGFTAVLPHRFRRDVDVVILATGYDGPGSPGDAVDDARSRPDCGDLIVDDVWAARDTSARAPSTTSQASPEGPRELIAIGTGLTFVDQAATHLGRAPENTIIGISRHGWLPHAHRGHHGEPPPFTATSDTEVGDMVTFLRGLGDKWQDGVDALRPHIQTIWRQSTDEQRQRFLTENGAWWSVHRHRMAPEVAERLRSWQSEGRLQIVRGAVSEVSRSGSRVVVTTTGGQVISGDALLNCTGRDGRPRRGLAAELLTRGLATSGPMGWGLGVDLPSLRVRRSATEAHTSLYAIGPLVLGELFETTAIPEIRAQAALIAEAVCSALSPVTPA